MGDGKTMDGWVVKVAMGLLSSDEERYAIGRDRLERLALSKLPSTWRNQHGDDVKILLMADDYLVSALRFAVRAAVARRAFRIEHYMRLAAFADHDLGGEAAVDAFDAELDSILKSGWRDHASPRLAALVVEARFRGLEEASEERLSEYADCLDVAETGRVLGVFALEMEKR